MARIPNIESTGYSNFPGKGWFDVTKYGARGDNSTNNTTAIQTAIDAAVAEGGGTLWFPPGTYRIGSTITLADIVSLEGAPYFTSLRMNHASQDMFVAASTSNNSSPQTRISNIAFEGTVSNTGNIFEIPGASNWRMIFQNCTYNAALTNLSGRFFRADSGSNTSVTFRDCYIRQIATNTSAIHMAGGGALTLTDSHVFMPQSYTNTLLTVNGCRANIHNNLFDLTAHTTGSNATVMYFGDNVANRNHIVSNNDFTRVSGVGFPVTCVGWDSGTLVTSTGNYFQHNVGITPYGLGLAGVGSECRSRPLFPRTLIGTSVTIPDGYEAIVINGNQTAPNITMPTKVYPGQRLKVELRNASGSSWDHNYFVGVSMATTIIGPSQYGTFDFVVADVSTAGTYEWVIFNDVYS